MATNNYIVRQPIKNTGHQVIGHEILYYGENELYGSLGNDSASDGTFNEFAVADAIYNFLTQNSEKAFRGSLNFMTFTTTLLMKKVPRLFAPSDLVIQIDDSVIIHPLAMHFVQQYKREGYRIAVNEFQFAPRYLDILDAIDYLRLNMHTLSDDSLHNILEIATSIGKQCIATEIDSDELYRKAVNAGVHALEGPAVAERLATKSHSSAYLQSSFFRLMVAVTRDEPNMAEIEQIISADASLTYALLRVANSVQYATRNRTTSVQQAIMKLGIEQLKQWIYLLSVGSGSNGGIDPFFEEFLKLSLIRAKFCSDIMNYTRVVPLSRGEAYLLGMFSTLHFLIDAPLSEILSALPIADEIKNALLYQQGASGMLYRLILSYESADWTEVSKLAAQIQIPAGILTGVYFEAMESADALWKSMQEFDR
ncbi:MAG: HDOD domain-containing protein [Oscillibacter sp.]|nr:HDOD domain-containing protein [Oscillibacter sp.]